MTENPGRRLTPARMALQRCEESRRQEEAGTWTPPVKEPYTPPLRTRRERIADQVFGRFCELPSVTFCGMAGMGERSVTDGRSDDIFAVLDLVNHCLNKKEVSTGHLACHCPGSLLGGQDSSDVVSTMKSHLAQLDKEDIGYTMLWHVLGETETQLAITSNDCEEFFDHIIDFIKDDVLNMLNKCARGQ